LGTALLLPLLLAPGGALGGLSAAALGARAAAPDTAHAAAATPLSLLLGTPPIHLPDGDSAPEADAPPAENGWRPARSLAPPLPPPDSPPAPLVVVAPPPTPSDSAAEPPLGVDTLLLVSRLSRGVLSVLRRALRGVAPRLPGAWFASKKAPCCWGCRKRIGATHNTVD